MSAKVLEVIRREIHEWAEVNFEFHGPKLGVLEEMGEMTHCILKQFQGIRGFDDKIFFKKEFTDAVADIGIYLLHSASIAGVSIVNEIEIEDIEGDLPTKENMEHHLGELCEQVGMLLANTEHNCFTNVEIHESILDKVATIASFYDVSLPEAIAFTWSKVRQRNWKENPLLGHQNTNE